MDWLQSTAVVYGSVYALFCWVVYVVLWEEMK